MPIVARLDELGRPAWIPLMILGFMMWWPVGFTVLAFIIGSGRMSCGYLQDRMERLGRGGWWGYHGSNRALPHRDAKAHGGRAARIPGLRGTRAPSKGQGGI
jgi:hypothetical protein